MTVRSITQEILGMAPVNGLINQIFPTIPTMDIATFQAGVASNTPRFGFVQSHAGRLGIFACEKNGETRAVILVLPASGKADRVVIGIGHGLSQNARVYAKLKWGNPLSKPHIEAILLKHVINRWGAEVLAGKRSMALMHIVRAAGNELGPFAKDGAFVAEVLGELQQLTKDAFSFNEVEVFGFSSGILNLNPFLQAASGSLNIKVVYNIDPAPSIDAFRPTGAALKQFKTRGAARQGFEFLPLSRWKNEPAFDRAKTIGDFQYLHNHCMPIYALHLGIQTS